MHTRSRNYSTNPRSPPKKRRRATKQEKDALRLSSSNNLPEPRLLTKLLRDLSLLPTIPNSYRQSPFDTVQSSFTYLPPNTLKTATRLERRSSFSTRLDSKRKSSIDNNAPTPYHHKRSLSEPHTTLQSILFSESHRNKSPHHKREQRPPELPISTSPKSIGTISSLALNFANIDLNLEKSVSYTPLDRSPHPIQLSETQFTRSNVIFPIHGTQDKDPVMIGSE